MKLPLIAGLAATATLTSALVIPSHAPKPSLIEPMATFLLSMPSQAAKHAHDSAPGIIIPNEGPEQTHPNAERNIAAHDADHLPIQNGMHMATSPEQDAFQGMPGPRLPTHNVVEMPTDDEIHKMWGPVEHSTAINDAIDLAAHNVLNLPTDAEKDAIHRMPGPVDQEGQQMGQIERRHPRCTIHGDAADGTPMCL